MVMRNLNVSDGVTNNTRVKIVRILNDVVIVQRIVPPFEILSICRVRFHFRLPYAQSFEIVRAQFPLRRAFALTYNKSQGQTLDKVLLDVRLLLFNHGYLYVGMSRVQLYSQIAFFINDKQCHPSSGSHVIVGNIVYTAVLNF
jgi:hypothetical protein